MYNRFMYNCSCNKNCWISVAPSFVRASSSKGALEHLQKSEPQKDWDFVKIDNMWHIKPRRVR
jgi:hypothetical protein